MLSTTFFSPVGHAPACPAAGWGCRYGGGRRDGRRLGHNQLAVGPGCDADAKPVEAELTGRVPRRDPATSAENLEAIRMP